MKKIIRMALICAVLTAAVAIQSCNTPKEVEILTEVTSTELLRTTQSWNEEELPDYPQGKPELVAVKYTIPPGSRLGWHHHVSMNHGVLVQGELTIIGVDGKTAVIKEGEVVVEMVDAIHRGENRGDKTVVLYMFYLSKEGLPLSVQNPEVQL
jgi:quercetin dioxygenase-like cupin family protein